MNSKVKKSLFWGGIIASMILVVNVFHYLFGGLQAFAAGPNGHGPRGMAHHGGFGDFGPQRMIGHHYHGGFSWIWFLLFLILAIVALALLIRGVRKKSKAAAMQQFIDTNLMSSTRTFVNHNENILDQWEKNTVNKKENQ